MSNRFRYSLTRFIRLALVSLVWVWVCGSVCGCGSAPSPDAAAPSRETAPGSPLPGEPTTPFQVESDDIVVGSKDAPVTVLLFLDFTDPASARALALAQSLSEAQGEKAVRIVLKPIPTARSVESVPSALAAQTAELLAGDRRAFGYARQLAANQERLGPTWYVEQAERAGLDAAEFRRILADEGTGARVGADVMLAKRLGLQLVPTFFVNGRAILGLPSRTQLFALVETEARATLALRDSKPADEAYAARVNDNAMRSLIAPLIGEEFAASGATVTETSHADAAVPVSANDPSWGSPLAPVTVVEFADFESPFSARVQATLDNIRTVYGPEKVRIVWKHHPLPFHKRARPAHEAAAAVFGLGGGKAFWTFQTLAFLHRSELTDENFRAWAVESGVAADAWEEAYRTGTFASKIDADIALSSKVAANGTPNFRINGLTLSGAQPFEKFKAVIDAQLVEAAQLVTSGVKPVEIYPRLVAKYVARSEEVAREEEPPLDPTVWSVPVGPDDPSWGPQDALVTIVEFAEFQCPFCKRASETMKRVLERYPNDVRLVWKDNPLTFHPRARPAANAARAIFERKGNAGFWAAHDSLFTSQPKLEDADIRAALAGTGVPWSFVSAAIEKDKYAAKIELSIDLATDLEARGTPQFFVNGIRLAGAHPFEKFRPLIDAELVKARQMVAGGTKKADVYAEIVKAGKVPPPPERRAMPRIPSDAPVKGNRSARITMVQFSDFECPFCARVNSTLEQFLKEHGSEVKVVWINYPLPFHKNAPLAAEAAYEVYRQLGDKAFWKYHDKLFAAQKEPGGIERENLEHFAGELGANVAKLADALNRRTHQAKLESDMAIAEEAGVSGTPSFLINGYTITGAQSLATFEKTLRLAKAAK
ncbi:MAG TPA: thioredoxin domain-containing protein [Polyangiaceae bacterium]|nr:thioredoxin domain-containing protein [Polyangiaceae bacterium]